MMTIAVCTEIEAGRTWLTKYRGQVPNFVCILGFTETCLVPGISAAGKTPEDRRYTALADGEFLYHGVSPNPQYPLPPLVAGASPVYITRAIVSDLNWPLYLFNAGLPQSPTVPHIDLDGVPARCVSTGQAIDLELVEQLFDRGLYWGERLALETPSYTILSECVVGGTTTALSVLMALGIDAAGKVNSSHPHCNHDQKLDLVGRGLAEFQLPLDPFAAIAAVGDPMQIVAAGMTIALSNHRGVLLAGGTQMLAVYALAQAIARSRALTWQPERVVVGTTRWVAADPTGDTIALAQTIGDVPLLATQLNFTTSRYPQLQAYERGFVKEGVGAGGAAIGAELMGWTQPDLGQAIESLIAQQEYQQAFCPTTNQKVH
jgi:uncharacterized protein (TIGR00303 family)